MIDLLKRFRKCLQQEGFSLPNSYARVTIRDVAKEASVSVTTVSRALKPEE